MPANTTEIKKRLWDAADDLCANPKFEKAEKERLRKDLRFPPGSSTIDNANHLFVRQSISSDLLREVRS